MMSEAAPGSRMQLLGVRQLLLVAAAASQKPAASSQAPDATAQVPAYEVASSHQNPNPNPCWNMSFTADGVHAVDATMRWALDTAYDVPDGSLWPGGPAWLRSSAL
jgi:hypothetical protein